MFIAASLFSWESWNTLAVFSVEAFFKYKSWFNLKTYRPNKIAFNAILDGKIIKI